MHLCWGNSTFIGVHALMEQNILLLLLLLLLLTSSAFFTAPAQCARPLFCSSTHAPGASLPH